MTFYKMKQAAINDIEEIINKGDTVLIDLLVYSTIKKYGFSRKFVENHIKVLHSLGFVEIFGDSVKTTKQKEVDKNGKGDTRNKH